MEAELKKDIIAKTEELMAAPTACAEIKKAAAAWIDAIDSSDEKKATQLYLAELEESIVAIDDLIALAGSKTGEAIFGTDKAASILSHAKEIKAGGAIYCDCPACAAVEAILARRDELQ